MVYGGKLPVGKLPEDVLKKHVLKHLGHQRRDVVLWPGYGEDAGAVKTSKTVYVLSTDPITGSKRFVGWLSVHASANDVAVSGAKPAWFSSTILLPKGSGYSDLSKIVRQIHSACRRLEVAVVTGHSEVAPFVTSPTVIGHMIGRLIVKKPITSHGAKPGDHIVMAKSVGLEGAAIIASDYPHLLRRKNIGVKDITRASGFIRRTSVVEEALAFAREGVSAMHDPTEGGLVGGLYEMAQASSVGFYVERSKVLVDPLVEKICRAVDIDPLKLISSGTLLATAPRLSRTIMEKTGARVIGRVVRRKMGMRILSENGEERIQGPVHDELWRFIVETK
ncbi:MAG: AIR synthase family protein [Candidatus Caldarchaeum sp.]